ncbi:MAG TPA: hypothetical protein VIR63_06030, partial [Pontiella sp.]
MKHVLRGSLLGCAIFLGVAGVVCAGDAEVEKAPIPTHADAALFFAKYSGLFERYVDSDANLTECVTFLNSKGVYFDLMEVVEGREFAINDAARVLAQIHLIFSGDAEFDQGQVKLPKGIDSWKEFCILNDVQFNEGYRALRLALVS